MVQVDEATYPHRSAEDWKRVPIRPCSWGMAMTRSDKLMQARSGKLSEELSRTCTDIITERLAS